MRHHIANIGPVLHTRIRQASICLGDQVLLLVWDLLKIANIGGVGLIVGVDAARRAVDQVHDTLNAGANEDFGNGLHVCGAN